VEKHGLEKIKTIGDGYLAVSGLPAETHDHAHRACLAALEIRDAMAKRNAER
jgi:class 3 adenylate cyclase